MGFVVDDARFREHFVVVWSTCLLAGHVVPAHTIPELQLRKRSEGVEPLKRAVHELARLWVDLIERQQAPAIRCDLQHCFPNELGLRLVDEVVEVDACPARFDDVLVGVRLELGSGASVQIWVIESCVVRTNLAIVERKVPNRQRFRVPRVGHADQAEAVRPGA